MHNSEVSLEQRALSSAQLASDLSAKIQQYRICLSSDSEVQIVTQIKETQQNQPMFTINGFTNWRRGHPVELGRHAHGKLEIDSDFGLYY